MDLNELTPENSTVSPKIELTNDSIAYLDETRKWAIFLSILGFIFLGLMLIMSFSFGAIFSAFGAHSEQPAFPGFLIVVYVVMIGIYFFPIFYLYKFASSTKKGLQERNKDQLADGFKNLKSHYKYIGVFTIIILGIYLLVFMIGGVFRFFV